MRPPAPVPSTRLRSMLCSRAILRTSGESGPAGSAGRRAARGGRGRRDGLARERRGGSGRRAGARRGFGCVGAAGAAAAHPAAFLDARHHGVDAHRLAFFHQDFGERAGGRRRESPYPPCRWRSQTAARRAPRARRASSATWSASLPRCFRPSGASLRRSCSVLSFVSCEDGHRAPRSSSISQSKTRPKCAASVRRHFFQARAHAKLRHGRDRLRSARRERCTGNSSNRCATFRAKPCEVTQRLDVHADGGDLALSHPHARQLGNARRPRCRNRPACR